MRVLVTGGSGFIGSHVVDKLRDAGIGVRVYDIVRPTSRQDIEFCQANVLDSDALRMALYGMDAVMHLAAVADVKDVFNDPHHAESVNVRGTLNVLEAMRLNGVRRVLYASTVWVYEGADSAVVDETTPLQPPAHLYTATKLAGEYYCHSYSSLYGLETTILRYGVPYGPRARSGGVIPTLVRKALNGDALTIAGDGSQFRKFVYVEDLADGNVLALKSAATNRMYNLDGAEKIQIRDIVDALQRIVGPCQIRNVPGRPADFSGREVSSRLAREDLGWNPRIRFEQGLHNYIKALRAEPSARQACAVAERDSLVR